MIKISLLFLLLSHSIFSKVLEQKSFEVGPHKGKFVLSYEEGNLLGDIYFKDKVISHFIKSAATEKLKKVEHIKGKKFDFLLVSFEKGVHGEAFELWKLPYSNGAATLAFEFKSIWPITIEKGKDSFNLTYFDASKTINGEKLVKDFSLYPE